MLQPLSRPWTCLAREYDQPPETLRWGNGLCTVRRVTWFGGIGAAFLTAFTLAGASPMLPDDLDPSFGDGGHVLIAGAETSQPPNGSKSILQPDSKIVLVWHMGATFDDADFVVARFTPDGSADPTFGSAGFVRTPVNLTEHGNDQLRAVAVDPSGRVLVGGYAQDPTNHYQWVFARYTPTGALDTSFGTGGLVILDLGGGSNWRNGPYDVGRQDRRRRSDGPVLDCGPPDTGRCSGSVLRERWRCARDLRRREHHQRGNVCGAPERWADPRGGGRDGQFARQVCTRPLPTEWCAGRDVRAARRRSHVRPWRSSHQ